MHAGLRKGWLMDINDFIDLAVSVQEDPPGRRHWTEQEEAVLRSLHGHVSDAEIGKVLGRSVTAVMEHWKRELHLPPPSRDPDYITCYQIALKLGVDTHIPPYWVDAGIILGEYIPKAGVQLWRRVRLDVLYDWLMDTDNWVWFRLDRVKDPDIKALLDKRQQEWGDEWWTTRQAADYHHVTPKDILRYVKFGLIKARHVQNRGGRGASGWANWFILRSEITRSDLVFKHRKG